MKRREFFALLGSAIVAIPCTVRSEQTSKVPKIGVLWHAGSAEEERVPLDALLQGFRDLGYVEGRNIIFEHRFNWLMKENCHLSAMLARWPKRQACF
jgi:putative tryptophan/tyrosine transport system substrate-binding protein